MEPDSPSTGREATLAIELAEARRELERARQRFRGAFGHQFQFMAILSPQGRVLDFNEQLAPGEGAPREQIVGRLFWDTVWWQGQPAMQAAWPARLQAAAAASRPLLSEDVFTSSSGEKRWATAALHAVRDADGGLDCFIVQASDITEKKHAEAVRASLEAQLRETQKMQAIGTLAGGIAHDFNNILAAILGNLALAADAVGPGHPALAPLAQIQRAGSRARSLVQQILAFSRREPHELHVQPLQPVLEETIGLLRTTLPADVNLATRLDRASLWARCDATQIQQVVMNLCMNAWHALNDGRGRIEVGAGHAADGRVHLWVGDDGSGMSADIRQRIFEPFFTTRPVDIGTGLGLSVVHGIVVEHGGTIEVDSAPGAGSVFHVYLPGVDAEPEPEPTCPAELGLAQATADGAGRHVLFLDDDPAMLPLASALLTRAGYRVTTFHDPELALAALRAEPSVFDGIVTDFNMPGRNGLDVLRELASIAPGLPAVMASGYIDDALRAEAARHGVRHLLHKENMRDDLCRLVQLALDDD
ncbi:MAG: ATP-binding protein [Caldimonas sp.]